MIALVSEPTIKKAYEVAQISNNTWLNNEAFKKAFTKFKSDMMKATTAKLQAHTTNAVDVLAEIMTDENAPPNARVQSVRTILEYAYKGIELETIEERLERIEYEMKVGRYNGL